MTCTAVRPITTSAASQNHRGKRHDDGDSSIGDFPSACKQPRASLHGRRRDGGLCLVNGRMGVRYETVIALNVVSRFGEGIELCSIERTFDFYTIFDLTQGHSYKHSRRVMKE